MTEIKSGPILLEAAGKFIDRATGVLREDGGIDNSKTPVERCRLALAHNWDVHHAMDCLVILRFMDMHGCTAIQVPAGCETPLNSENLFGDWWFWKSVDP